jgi:hypothetical protein
MILKNRSKWITTIQSKPSGIKPEPRLSTVGVGGSGFAPDGFLGLLFLRSEHTDSVTVVAEEAGRAGVDD